MHDPSVANIANIGVTIKTGGLYRCCVAFLEQFTLSTPVELVPNDRATCPTCRESFELDVNRRWRWLQSS